jgi:hypothetical protein
MDEQTRLLTLAHLKNGTKPADAADLMGISYATCLKLRKELEAAEKKNKILQLFSLDEAALDILLESVTKQLKPAIEAFDIGELVEVEVQDLKERVDGGSLLNQELQSAGSALANKIKQTATIATSADTILSLAKALCELNNSFFGEGKGNSVGALPATSFEKHLRN